MTGVPNFAHRKMWASMRRAWPLAIVLGVASVTSALAPTESASANHIYSPYGNYGFAWFATYRDNAVAWVTSTRCDANELGAYTNVLNSTKDASYLRDRWPSGIRMSRHGCDGTVSNSTDIKLQYESNWAQRYGREYGGFNESFKAPSSWCAAYGFNYPCGTHYALVHLNLTRFTSSSYSTAYRKRLIMHETGHSMGLNHHCSANSIMNDGTSGCNNGAWTNVMSYLSTDRSGIRNIYPNWMYN